MSEGSGPRWYKSLYWRIALGLFAFLALMLAAQGALFLWMTDRVAGSMPARDPRRLAFLVASDVGTALTADPDLDLAEYIRDQYGNVFQTFVVIMHDGRIASNDQDMPDDLLKAMVAEASRRDFPLRGRRPGGAGPAVAAPRGARRAAEFAPVVVDGALAGRVAVVPGGPPFSRVVRELGPTMGVVGGGVLVVGMGLIAFVIFGPVRKRLKQVQDAAERLGSGDLGARALADGGDEVAAVARSFNRMAEELAARATALEASDKARRQLLADVSHELMTPLTAMRGYVETLSMPELQIDSDTGRRYLGIVTEETHRLEKIIGDLLDLARLEGGGGTLRRDSVDVQSLFDRVAERHEREMRERGVTLIRNVSSGASHVTGDADRLEQALQNLAANALRHSDKGGTISLEAAPVERGIRLRVRDAGAGIAPEHLPLIFDRFYKVDAARKASGGSGLGLSIVKTIVERHGGTITAYNQNGAVFDIVLPA
ncbi:MAG TPA: HAMP domain-containing sensor histidine kinase [Vicinamibacterales bacterium]|jgi:signal transduction histidine kinase|nr:HAMP domain-containing sensor histidine kinase [Vicinamibacterales bacterium]